MKLKCGTILNIYTHNNKAILCQIKVPSLKYKQSRENTCRFFTPHQWNLFDIELEQLIDSQYNNDELHEEKFFKFNVKPDIEVKVQKSKLSTTNFYNCFGSDKIGDDECDIDGSGIENIDSNGGFGHIKQTAYVLECILEYKEQTPSILTIQESQEYEPKLENSTDGQPLGPSSYEPYTPSKKKYRINSPDTIKTPDADFLGYESTEDTYSPMPMLGGTTISKTSASIEIPEYTPAPITAKRSSKDSVKSNHKETINDVVFESDDEHVLMQNYRTLRNRKTKNKSKIIEYIPKSQDINEAPEYVPTPIEEIQHNKKDVERKSDSNEHVKTENYIHDEHLKIVDEKPSVSQVNTKNPQTSKIKGKIRKKLNYKEKYRTRLENTNTEIAKSVLLKPATTSSSEDDLDYFCSGTKTKLRKENDGAKFEPVSMEQNTTLQKTSIHKKDDLNVTTSSVTESSTDSSLHKMRKREMPKKLSDHDTANLRRSERSPKPRRLIEESTKLEIKNKSKPQNTSLRDKELFGSEFEDDDFEKNIEDDNNNNAADVVTTKTNAPITHTPKNEKRQNPCSSSSSSTKNKRKRGKSSECEQEKRTISSWLGKKKSNSDIGPATTSKEKPISTSSMKTKKIDCKNKDNKHRGSKSESPPPPSPVDFVIPTKKELEEMRIKTKLQHENNEKIKAELEKIIAPPPIKVTNLSLKDMSVSDLLTTFDDHKHILDDIYERNRKKDHIKSHDGINHCFVIRLMEPQMQMKMLEKLIDVYSSSNNTTKATLYANAMLPEWIIRIFMDKYSFSREDAMQQIKAQDDYQLYINEQNESVFMFD